MTIEEAGSPNRRERRLQRRMPRSSEREEVTYDKAKTAGEAEAQDRRIADELRRQREGEPAAVPVLVPAAGGQTAITDFGGASA